MAKVLVDVTRLAGTDVARVSLVKHNATRIPFRITKGEDDMIDLAQIGRSLFRKADAPVAVASVMLSKTADVASIVEVLKAQGFNMDTQTEVDDAWVYAQPGVVAGSRSGVLKCNDDVAFIVSGLANVPQAVTKDFQAWNLESTNFTEVLNTNGFYPAVYMAMESVAKCVSNIMDDAADPAEAQAMISTTFDDAKAYISGILSGIPVTAFKADSALQKAAKAVVTVDAVAEVANGDATQTEATTEAVTEVTKAAADASAVADPVVDAVVKEDDPVPAVTDAKKADDAAVMAAGMQALQASVDAFSARILAGLDEVKITVTDLDARVQKAEEAVNGTVVVDATGDKPGRTTTRATKGDSGPPPLLDTAFARVA